MRAGLFAGTLVFAMTAAVAADNYPTRPVRLVVPFAPGGGNDIAARFVALRLTEAFGQSAVVDNRAGAGSTIGADIVAKSAPDGYTLLVVHNAIAINQTLYAKLPYDTVRDFAQVAMIGATTNALVVNPGVAARSTKDLIALVKNKPGGLNHASTGAGQSAEGNHPRLNAEVVKALSKPAVKERLFKQGIEAQIMTPAEFTKHARSEVAKMGKIIKTSGAKAEH